MENIRYRLTSHISSSRAFKAAARSIKARKIPIRVSEQ
jgi:hypothetical protein